MDTDKIEGWLHTHGHPVIPYYWLHTRIQLGWQFTYRGCDVCWRCEGNRIWIVMFRRQEKRGGLDNSFAVLYVLAQAALATYGPGYSLYGNVDMLAGSPLQANRLRRFYLRWAGAAEPSPGWFELDVGRVCSLRSRRNQQNAADD